MISVVFADDQRFDALKKSGGLIFGLDADATPVIFADDPRFSAYVKRGKIISGFEPSRVYAKDFDSDQPRDREGKWAKVGVDRSKLPPHVPRIPPAWTDVQVNMDPDGDLLVIGVDSKGRRQAIYSEKHATRQAVAKFARIEQLQKKLDTVSHQNEGMRKSNDLKTKDAADATKLIIETGIRPGGDKDTKAAQQAYGATTLEGRHVTSDGGRLQFVGKKGVAIDVTVDDHSTRQMILRRKELAGDRGRLFPNITSSDLLDHVHSLNGGSFKTKDFRTAVANGVAMAAIKKTTAPKTEREYKAAVRSVAKVVSTKLGNTPTVALQSYINPSIFAEWRMAAHV